MARAYPGIAAAGEEAEEGKRSLRERDISGAAAVAAAEGGSPCIRLAVATTVCCLPDRRKWVEAADR